MICLMTTAGLTCLLTTNKLLIVLFPLRSGAWSTRRIHVICAAAWLANCFTPGQIERYFFLRSNHLKFSYLDYNCGYNEDLSPAPKWLNDTARVFPHAVLFIAAIVMIVTSSVLLYKARRLALQQGGCLKWQGVVTVVSTTFVYLLSSFPWFFLAITSIDDLKAWRFALFISNLNIMANFYVYCLTVKSFRMWLKKMVKKWSHSVRGVRSRIISSSREVESNRSSV